MPTSDVELAEIGAGPTGQCFVCFEDNAPLSQCRCNDRYIHPACLFKMVGTNGKTACAVCLVEYTNIKVVTSRRVTWRALRCMTMATIIPILLFVAVWRGEAWLSSPYGEDRDIDVSKGMECLFELLAVIMLALCICSEGFLYATGQWRLLVATRTARMSMSATNC